MHKLTPFETFWHAAAFFGSLPLMFGWFLFWQWLDIFAIAVLAPLLFAPWVLLCAHMDKS